MNTRSAIPMTKPARTLPPMRIAQGDIFSVIEGCGAGGVWIAGEPSAGAVAGGGALKKVVIFPAVPLLNRITDRVNSPFCQLCMPKKWAMNLERAVGIATGSMLMVSWNR